MSRRSNSKRSSEEKLDLVYSRRRDDIEDAFEYQFGPQPVETGTVPLTTTVPDTTTVPEFKPRLVPPQESRSLERAVQTGTVPVSPRPRTRVFRATRVEHAHTPGERLVLQSLWTKAAGNDRERTIRIGYDRLATIASVNWKTARACLRSLEQKLAIETLEPENPNSREGRLYRIFGFELILERRQQAGLEWVQKGRGVEFLQAGTVPVNGTVPLNTTVPVAGADTPPDSGGETVPLSGAPLRSSKEEKKESSSLSSDTAPTEIVRALIETTGGSDDRAARKLLKECRERAPNITDEEIAELVRREGKRSRTMRNPMGFVLLQVPRCCEGESFTQFRAALSVYRDSERLAQAEMLERIKQVLNDPKSTELERSWAKNLQATENAG